MKTCETCQRPLSGRQRKYCAECAIAAGRARRSARKKWRRKNDLAWFRYRKTREVASRKGLPCELSSEDVARILDNPCAYCGDREEKMGLDRVDSSRGYVLENVVPCCWFCNQAKNDFSVNHFLEKCSRIAAVRHRAQQIR